MPIQSPGELNSLAMHLIVNGTTSSDIERLAVLKTGKTFADFKKAWETPIDGKIVGGSFEELATLRAERLFVAGVIEESLVPSRS